MRPNLSALIKDEVVRRFEDVVREEIRLYNISIKKTDESISKIVDKIDYLERKIDLNFLENKNICDDAKRSFVKERENLEKGLKKDREIISSSSKNLNEKIKEFECVLSDFCSKSDLDKIERSIFKHCNETYYDMLQSVDAFKQYLHENNSSLQKKLIDMVEKLEGSNKELERKLELYRSSSSSQKVESDSVLRELQVYKRSMFIIDKKIENLYTLIERLSARNSL